jgi:hypothetical protein
MNSKTLIQIILTIIIIIISGIFFYEYFYKNTSYEKKIELTKNEKLNIKNNTIKDIAYNSEDENGNIYLIKSEYGEFSTLNENIIFMTQVKATIKLNDGSEMKLASTNAKYDILNNDTNFFNDVNLYYQEHSVNSDNIDIFFNNGKLAAYGNLVYKNLDLDLIADKVEIDLISKDSKIFMLNDKKVRILKKK